jgi:predicted dehydrogenase
MMLSFSLYKRNPFLFSLNMRMPFQPENPYLNTAWRNKPSWYGGLFVDAFVHATAMLRKILGSEAKFISAITSSQADYLPSVDTMAAHVEFQSGVQGSIATTYACSSMKFELEITGTKGTVLLQRKLDGPGYRITVNDNEVEEYGFGGIEGELLSFADACRRGRDVDCNTPEEAMKDLMFVEACLKSGQNNGKRITLIGQNKNAIAIE